MLVLIICQLSLSQLWFKQQMIMAYDEDDVRLPRAMILSRISQAMFSIQYLLIMLRKSKGIIKVEEDDRGEECLVQHFQDLFQHL